MNQHYQNILFETRCETKGGNMNDVIIKYVAERIVEDLRTNKQLNEDLAEALNSYEWLGNLRKLITVKDKDWLRQIILANQSPVGELCINLMHSIREEKDVKEFLFDLWRAPSSKYWTKMQVMWRLLDYPDLSEDIHKNIYEFMRSDWNKWITYVVEKFGGKNEVLESSKERLSNPSFPESKAWVYLCIAAASDNSTDAKNLIAKYARSKSSINAVVVNDLLNLMGK